VTTAVLLAQVARDTRLTARLGAAEAEQIVRLAAAAGLSVSAYLRDRALGLSAQPDEAAALRQMDALIERMEAESGLRDCRIGRNHSADGQGRVMDRFDRLARRVMPQAIGGIEMLHGGSKILEIIERLAEREMQRRRPTPR